MRVATYNVGLSRAGPGLLLHELVQGPKPQLDAVLRVIRAVRPDVLLLTGFDHDLRGRALAAFQARLAAGAGRHRLPVCLPARRSMPGCRRGATSTATGC